MDANENLAATNSEEAAILSIEPSDEFGASTDKPSRKRLNHLDPAVNPLGLSKNQLRKKMRREERREALMAKRIAERKRKKISTREKWIKAKAEAPDVKFLSKKETIKRRKAKLTAAKDSGQKVAIDMSFCDIMSPKEIKQLARQVNLLYSSTGRAEQLWSLNIVGLQPESFLHSELKRHCNGFDQYILNVSDKAVEDLFEREKLVYLSPDGEEVMESVDPEAVYVIGGIVDGSAKPNVTRNKADGLGIRSMRLPILETLERSDKWKGQDTILTLNQVYDILINFSATGDLLAALEKSIPPRKGLVKKEEKLEGEGANVDGDQ